MDRAFHAVVGQNLVKNDEHVSMPAVDPEFTIHDFPISPMQGKSAYLVGYVEVVDDVDYIDFAGANFDEMKLRDPFRFPEGGRTQYYTTGAVRGKVTLVKFVSFDQKAAVKHIREHAVGRLYSLRMMAGYAPRLCQMAVHYIGSRLGGPSYVSFVLDQTKKNPQPQLRSPDELVEGFAYIKEFGPLGSDENQNVEWAETQRATQESPLHGWSVGLIKESLGNITRGRTTAQAQKYYPVTLKDIKSPILQDLVIPFLARSGEHGAIWAGASGVGKTPLSRAIAMALSEFHIGNSTRAELDPHFRAGNHLDFFRGAVGTIFGPSIYDDGEPSDNKPGDLKTFLDPSEPEVQQDEAIHPIQSTRTPRHDTSSLFESL